MDQEGRRAQRNRRRNQQQQQQQQQEEENYQQPNTQQINDINFYNNNNNQNNNNNNQNNNNNNDLYSTTTNQMNNLKIQDQDDSDDLIGFEDTNNGGYNFIKNNINPSKNQNSSNEVEINSQNSNNNNDQQQEIDIKNVQLIDQQQEDNHQKDRRKERRNNRQQEQQEQQGLQNHQQHIQQHQQTTHNQLQQVDQKLQQFKQNLQNHQQQISNQQKNNNNENQNQKQQQNNNNKDSNVINDSQSEDNEEEEDEEYRIQQAIKYRKLYQHVQPLPNPNFSVQESERREFLYSPLPQGLLFQCTIRKEGTLKYPVYHMTLSLGTSQYLMSCKKRSGNQTSNYLISMDYNYLDRKHPSFIGKIRANSDHSKYSIYDTGENPKNCKKMEQVRCDLAGVMISQNQQPGKQQFRKLNVVIPAVNKITGEVYVHRPVYENDTLIGKYSILNDKLIHYYSSKEPTFNSSTSLFEFQFSQRITQHSNKNFKLIDVVNQEIVYLEFGQAGTDMYNLDAQYPLSPIQAFGICISNLDSKVGQK